VVYEVAVQPSHHKVTHSAYVTECHVCDIVPFCINLIMHRVRRGPDGMHYEIVNCNVVFFGVL
jgi:hypothetical protein